MKTKHFIPFAVLGVFLLAGCDQEKPTPETKPNEVQKNYTPEEEKRMENAIKNLPPRGEKK